MGIALSIVSSEIRTAVESHRAISQTTNGSAITTNHTAIMSATRIGAYGVDGRANTLARSRAVVR